MVTPLTLVQRQALLRKWIMPASVTEDEYWKRAARMVDEAIAAHPAFAPVRSKLKVYAKGSYPNNTNVRANSDVDISVQLNEPQYADYHPMTNHWQRRQRLPDYEGIWTPALLRAEVGKALTAKFGTIDTSHRVAFYVPPVFNSRPSIDVVPAFRYVQFTNPQCTEGTEGSMVHCTDGKTIVNWPQQQMDNGRAKSTRTNNRYKYVVRVLKSVEDTLTAGKVIDEVPSYFSECLVYNVPDSVLTFGDFDASVRETLRHLDRELGYWMGHYQTMVEPNGIKKLFGDEQKWSVATAREFVKQSMTYLNYG
ncbi:hypothetical protein [Kitasatospora sp. MBT63]|uniref:hypothetical protein n=1 Tax=Kitasatospora sp. MBT63 TaxID=1444768 RepID=UPI00068CCA21|nr:hypothetical protein [Kitasatospora sp. MBT63]